MRIALNHVQGWIYDITGGRVGGRLGGQPVLLLTTTGRRSGQARRTPVQYASLEGKILLVAAGGGSPSAPAWWHNLRADPQVVVQLGAVRHAANATTLPESERDRLWPQLCAGNRFLARVQEKAGRRLAVVSVTLEAPPGPSVD